MRVVKEAEVRKNEILDAAECLFSAKGFDNTSTEDILSAVGIARGTLYYHFKSKEDILNAMIDRMTARLLERAAGIAAQKDVPVLRRLTRAMIALNVDNALEQEILEQIHRPQNALMHQKLQSHLLVKVTPLIAGLVEEGIAQGIFRTDYPVEVVEMTLLYTNTAFDALAFAEHSEEERRQKIEGFIYNLERMLGMEPGSMRETILLIFQRDGRAI